MGRFMFGLFLQAGAIFALIFFVFNLSDVNPVNPLAGVVCGQGGFITTNDSMNDFLDMGGSFPEDGVIYCNTPDERQTDITQNLIMGIVVIVVGGFVFGFIFEISGMMQMYHLARASQTQPYGNTYDYLSPKRKNKDANVTDLGSGVFAVRDSQSVTVTMGSQSMDMKDLPESAQQFLKQTLDDLDKMMPPLDMKTPQDLSKRLEEIQGLRDKGVITSEEYEDMRQKLLDNWSRNV
jgi:hypothetical protein